MGPFDFPNFLYSQRIALLSFKPSSRNLSSLDLDCATIADVILLLLLTSRVDISIIKIRLNEYANEGAGLRIKFHEYFIVLG